MNVKSSYSNIFYRKNCPIGPRFLVAKLHSEELEDAVPEDVQLPVLMSYVYVGVQEVLANVQSTPLSLLTSA